MKGLRTIMLNLKSHLGSKILSKLLKHLKRLSLNYKIFSIKKKVICKNHKLLDSILKIKVNNLKMKGDNSHKMMKVKK